MTTENKPQETILQPVKPFAYSDPMWANGLSYREPRTRVEKSFHSLYSPLHSKKTEHLKQHVTPQQRAEAIYDAKSAKKPLYDMIDTAWVCRETPEGKKCSTINTSITLVVEELVYPGYAGETQKVSGKWIYVIDMKQMRFLGEFFAESAEKWHFRHNPQFTNDKKPPKMLPCDEPKIKNLPGFNGGTRPDTGVFLSPFRLTADAANFLMASSERVKAVCVIPYKLLYGAVPTYYAAVPDPFRWAEDAHQQFMVAFLEQWQSFVFDPEIQTKNFIAGTLKAWKDAEKIKGLGIGEPEGFFNNYKVTEEKLRLNAELAMMYVENCIDSPEHKIVEKAADTAKGEALNCTFKHWACISGRLVETARGRMFAVKLAKDKERVPKKYLFPDEPSQSFPDFIAESFPNSRFTWLAGVAIFGEMVSAAINYEESGRMRKSAIKYMEHLGIKDVQSIVNPPKSIRNRLKDPKVGPVLYENLKKIDLEVEEAHKAGKFIRQPFSSIDDGIKQNRIKKSVDQLYYDIWNEAKAAGKALPPDVFEQQLLDLQSKYDQPLQETRYPIGIVIEAINLTISALALAEEEKDPMLREAKIISLIGSIGDFASTVASAVETHYTTQAAAARAAGDRTSFKTLEIAGGRAKFVGGAIGFIAGACQMYDEERQAVDAYAQNDYGVSNGHAIAAAGAAMTAIGGAAAAVSYITAGAAGGAMLGGPFGAVVAGIGAGLILFGNAVAAAAKMNIFEQFAAHSFIGSQHNDKVMYPDWFPQGLPTKDIYREARVLLWIIGSFQISLEGSGHINTVSPNGKPESYIVISPGYVTPESTFEIVMEQEYGYGANAETYQANIHIKRGAEKISFNGGSIEPNVKDSEVKYDAMGNIQMIKFPIQPVALINNKQGYIEFDNYGKRMEAKSCKIRVRLNMNSWVAPNLTAQAGESNGNNGNGKEDALMNRSSWNVYVPSITESVEIDTLNGEWSTNMGKLPGKPLFITTEKRVSSLDTKKWVK